MEQTSCYSTLDLFQDKRSLKGAGFTDTRTVTLADKPRQDGEDNILYTWQRQLCDYIWHQHITPSFQHFEPNRVNY